MAKHAKHAAQPAGQGPAAPGQNLLEWYEALVSAIVILVLLFSFFLRILRVQGSSMVPTLQDGDRLIAWGAGYQPEAGDVVIVDGYTPYGAPLVKRIIAEGGDTVYIDFVTGQVQVNGQTLAEPYLAEPTWLAYDVVFPYTVPEGEYFVMGDNRNGSLDSRSSQIGCIQKEDILGKVLMRFMPVNKLGLIH